MGSESKSIYIADRYFENDDICVLPGIGDSAVAKFQTSILTASVWKAKVYGIIE